MDSVKLIKIHAYIAKVHLIYGLLFVLYEIMWSKLILGKPIISSIDLIRIAAFCFVAALIAIDFIYALKEYYNNFKIIRVVRSMMAMCAAVILIAGTKRTYICFISMLLFVTLVIQIAYMTNIKRFRNKILLFLIVYMPVVVTSGVKIILLNDLSYSIRTIVFNLVFFSSMIILLTIISHVFAESSLEKKRLKNELQKINKTEKEDSSKNEVELENAYERLSRENSEMLIENLIQQYISSSLEISNLMKLILESLSEALVVNLCSIIVKDENSEKYQYDTRCMCNKFDIKCFNSHIEDGRLFEKFEELDEPFIDNQVNAAEYDFLEGMGIKSLLIYPLRNEYELLGLLVIGKDVNNYFLSNMSFFERVSTQFSIALANARTYTKMEDMAMKDGLTGIYNRTYMIQKFNEYISSAVLNKSALAIMLFDIDFFKMVNDKYGHLFGDEVIRVCASLAKETAEKNNGFAARYGGEEFVIVFQEESLEKLHQIATRLHNKIKQKEVNYRGDSRAINVSIGVAAYPATCDNPAELIDRADKAMYHSKEIGRGCITFDGEYTYV